MLTQFYWQGSLGVMTFSSGLLSSKHKTRDKKSENCDGLLGDREDKRQNPLPITHTL